jgi:cytolysin-activating lysine-acyltransferase
MQGKSRATGPADGEAQRQTAQEQAPSEINELQQFLRSRLMSASFGDIVALLSRSPAHKHYTLTDLEWCVLPPLALNQFLVAETKLASGDFIPVGLVFWARVSQEIDARLSETPRYPIRLQPDEWRSGDSYWIVDTVGEPEAVNQLIERLAQTVFSGQPFKALSAQGRAN